MHNPRRKFLRTMWGGMVVFGAGMVGFPFGACTSGGSRPSPDDLAGLDLDSLPEMTPEEVRDFMDQVDQAARDRLGPEHDLTHDRQQHDDLGADEVAHEVSTDQRSDPDTGDSTDTGEKPRLPPGQHLLEVMPILGHNQAPRGLADWRFYVKGEVEQELEFTWGEFLQLPRVQRLLDIHCVTSWSVFDVSFKGILVSTLLSMAGLKDSGKFVIFDCEQGYTTNIPIAEALKDNVLVANELFGEALPQKYGGPARGVVPDLYYYKSGKWLMGLRVLSEDEPGFWETRGYSNTADPWTNDRYS